MILAWMGDELWCGQAQNGIYLEFDLKFDLEGQGASLHKIIEILNKVFYTFSPNLVIPAWTGPELSHRQASDWHTGWHTHTHTQTQATTIPEGQNWPRVKMKKVKSFDQTMNPQKYIVFTGEPRGDLLDFWREDITPCREHIV